jgi:hypothetical protein
MYATVGWNFKICLCGADGRIWGDECDRVIFPEYWRKDPAYPHDPETGEALQIYSPAKNINVCLKRHNTARIAGAPCGL